MTRYCGPRATLGTQNASKLTIYKAVNSPFPPCHQASEAGLAQYADVECKRLGSKNLNTSDERTHPTLFSEGGAREETLSR